MRKSIFLFLVFSAFTQAYSQTIIRGANWGDSPSYIKSIERAPLMDEDDVELKTYNHVEKTLNYSVDFYGMQANLNYKFVNHKLSNISYIIEIEPIIFPNFEESFNVILSEFADKYGGYVNRGSIQYLPNKDAWIRLDSTFTAVLNTYYFEDDAWHEQQVKLLFTNEYSSIEIQLSAKPKGRDFPVKSCVLFIVEYEPLRYILPEI
jgi:hypothetical protein